MANKKIKYGEVKYTVEDKNVVVKVKDYKNGALKGFANVEIYQGKEFYSRYNFTIIETKKGELFLTEVGRKAKKDNGDWYTLTDFVAPKAIKEDVLKHIVE